MSGRTFFLKKDSAWWERGAVRRARKEFGPTGPAVMDWLECAAKRQNAGGRVKADPLTIAEDIGSDEVTVCHVVSHLVQKKWLVSHEVAGDLFKAKVTWYEADQRRGDAAERKAESRANQADPEPLSRPVTESHLRVEESREESTDQKRVPATAAVPAALAVHARIVHDQLSEYAATHSLPEPSKASLARIIKQRPHKPLVKAVGDYLAWQERQPPARQHKDLLRGYEWQLDNRHVDLAATERLAEDGTPLDASDRPTSITARGRSTEAQANDARRAAGLQSLMNGSEAA